MQQKLSMKGSVPLSVQLVHNMSALHASVHSKP